MCNRPLRVGAWQWGGCVGERELSPPTQEMVVGREESCQDWPSNPAGLRCPHPGEAGISRRVWNPLQKVARDAGKGGWRKDRVNLPTRDQEEKVGAGGFEEPLYSFPLTRTSWIQPRPPGGGAGKGGVSNWLKAEGTSDHPTLCNDAALTTHHHRPTMGWIPPRWIKPIILLWSRSELGSSPGLTRQKHINHSPHLPPPAHLSRPQYQIRSVPSFEETSPLSWLGAGEGRGSPAAPGGCTGVSRPQLPADLHAGLPAERPPRPSHRRQWPRGRGPVLACSRIHTLPAEGGSRSSSLRWFCPPTPHPRRLFPLPFLAPLGQREFQA